MNKKLTEPSNTELREVNRCYAEITRLENARQRLRQENQELKAHIERIRHIYDGWGFKAVNDGRTLVKFGEAMLDTPKQCLTAIKVEAIRDAVSYAHKKGSIHNGYLPYVEEYADQLEGG